MGLKKKNVSCDCDLPSLEQQLQEILENFDFHHVAMMMFWQSSRVEYNNDGTYKNYHQWKLYFPENGTCRVPSMYELEKKAKDLLEEVINFAKRNPREKFYMIGTGPFKATYRFGILELECIFESWSCD